MLIENGSTLIIPVLACTGSQASRLKLGEETGERVDTDMEMWTEVRRKC